MMFTTIESQVSIAAKQIAGSIFEDADGTLIERLESAIRHRNIGTDGDLTSEDRDALGLLLDVLTGATADLYDSDTANVIREATAEEAIESALARPEGHIAVDGRRCYVSL